MHVGEERGNCALAAAGRLRTPGSRIEFGKDELVHPLADGESFNKRFAKFCGRQGTSHRVSPHGFAMNVAYGLASRSKVAHFAKKRNYSEEVGRSTDLHLVARQNWLGGLDSNQDSQIQNLKKFLALDCSKSHQVGNREFAGFHTATSCRKTQEGTGLWRQFGDR